MSTMKGRKRSPWGEGGLSFRRVLSEGPRILRVDKESNPVLEHIPKVKTSHFFFGMSHFLVFFFLVLTNLFFNVL